jgi:hypothetical protein
MLITLNSDVTFYTLFGRLLKSNHTFVSTLETSTKQSMGPLLLKRLKCAQFSKHWFLCPLTLFHESGVGIFPSYRSKDETKFRPLFSKLDSNLRNNPAELKQQKKYYTVRKRLSFDTQLNQINPVRVPPSSIYKGIHVPPNPHLGI